MKKIFIVVLFVVSFLHVFAQDKKVNGYVTKEELVGTWQKGSKVVGSAMNQNFVFGKDGTFVLNLDSEGDDARNLIKLRGKYRLVKDELYLTILSRTYIDGDLEMGGMGMTFSLLQFGSNSKMREVKEANPKEMLDPCNIAVISRTNIKLNNQVYYKVK